jgi:hypothetical protein
MDGKLLFKIFIIFIVILFVIKLASNLYNTPKKQEIPELKNSVRGDIFVDGEKFYPGRTNQSNQYYFRMLYVVFYDDLSAEYVTRSGWENRTLLVKNIIETETKGKALIDIDIVFLNVKDLGEKYLDYESKTIYDWIEELNQQVILQNNSNSYNIVSFTPISGMPWCTDAPSQGYNRKGVIFICQEYFSPYNKNENLRAAGLIIHKIMHGLGYNHINQDNKQFLFLDWYEGLPETNILLHATADQFNHPFLGEHFLGVLGLQNRSKEDNKCLDAQGLVCKSKNSYYCENSWGDYCADIDNDGIIDNVDDYPLSSPVHGNDTDKDGIVDQLDLCPYNKIEFAGKSKGTLKIMEKTKAELVFQSKNLSIEKLEIIPSSVEAGFIRFNNKKAFYKSGNRINISKRDGNLLKINVYYNYKSKEYYRPFYLEFEGANANIVGEREWYFFSRFGCDIPAKLNLSDFEEYDENYDGLPDKEQFPWAEKIDESYDWDDDGFPDVNDSLPTVRGNCTDDFLRGVKDSDGDGLCDPGNFDFKDKSLAKYGEIVQKVDKRQNYDACPYFRGIKEKQGCE